MYSTSKKICYATITVALSFQLSQAQITPGCDCNINQDAAGNTTGQFGDITCNDLRVYDRIVGNAYNNSTSSLVLDDKTMTFTDSGRETATGGDSYLIIYGDEANNSSKITGGNDTITWTNDPSDATAEAWRLRVFGDSLNTNSSITTPSQFIGGNDTITVDGVRTGITESDSYSKSPGIRGDSFNYGIGNRAGKDQITLRNQAVVQGLVEDYFFSSSRARGGR